MTFEEVCVMLGVDDLSLLSKMEKDMTFEINKEFIEKLKQTVKQIANEVSSDQASTIEAFTQYYFSQFANENNPAEFTRIITQNQDNPFLLATIEYIAGEILIDSVVQYLTAVSALSQELRKNYSVFGAQNIFSPYSSF